MIYKKNEIGNMPKYAVLCRIEKSGVKTSEGGINLAKLGILPHRKAFERYDKNPIRLPRHDLPRYAKTLANKGFLRLQPSKKPTFYQH